MNKVVSVGQMRAIEAKAVANKEVRARITHIGGGKFRILEGAGGEYSDLKVNASGVIHYRE